MGMTRPVEWPSTPGVARPVTGVLPEEVQAAK